VRGAAATDYGTIDQVESRVFTDVFGVPDPGMEARQGALAEYTGNPPNRIWDGSSKTLMVSECAGRPESYVLRSRMTAAQFANYTDDEIIEVDGRFMADDGIGWADPDTGFEVKGFSEDGAEMFGARMINGINAGEAFSFPRGGAQFLFADGSVHFIDDNIDPWVYVSLCTRAGGEVVEDY
jgi:prepilin-type processing-associated H-X9-DG protein